MLNFRLVITTVFFIVVFSITALAQTAPVKIVLINTASFYDEKAGITKLVNAEKQLNTEFTAQIKALQDDNTKLQAIATELQNMQKLPVAPTAYAEKQEEGERLQRQIGYKKTDLEAAINKRRQALMGPISDDIGKALDEFAKKNGYGVIFDASKLVDAGSLLFLAESADITKDFVAFYNARTVAAAPPK